MYLEDLQTGDILTFSHGEKRVVIKGFRYCDICYREYHKDFILLIKDKKVVGFISLDYLDNDLSYEDKNRDFQKNTVEKVETGIGAHWLFDVLCSSVKSKTIENIPKGVLYWE